MTKLLFRYISRHFLKWFFWLSAITFVMIFLFDFAELMRRSAVKPHIAASLVVRMSLLKLPKLYEQVMPFIVLFSAMLSLWTLNRTHELTVFRASGLSVWAMTRPMMIAVTFLGGLDILLLNPLGAALMLRYEHLEDRHFKGHLGSLAVSESGLWFRDVQQGVQSIYHMKKIDKKTQSASSFFVFKTDGQDRFLMHVAGEKAFFTHGLIVVENAYVVQGYDLPVFYPSYTMTTSMSFEVLQDSGADPSSISFWRLSEYIERMEKSGLSAHRYRLYWHGLLSTWVWFSVMVLLAACCCLNPMRQGKNTRLMLIGVGFAFILYLLKDMSFALGLSHKLPVILGAWFPTIVSGLMSITVLLYSEDG